MPIAELALSPDGKKIGLAVQGGKKLKYGDADGDGVVPDVDKATAPATVNALAIYHSEDQGTDKGVDLLATCRNVGDNEDRAEIVVQNLKGEKQSFPALAKSEKKVSQFTFRPDGKALFVVTNLGNQVSQLVRDQTMPLVIPLPTDHRDPGTITSLAVSNGDDLRLAVGTNQKRIIGWKVSDDKATVSLNVPRELLGPAPANNASAISALAINADNSRLLFADPSGLRFLQLKDKDDAQTFNPVELQRLPYDMDLQASVGLIALGDPSGKKGRAVFANADKLFAWEPEVHKALGGSGSNVKQVVIDPAGKFALTVPNDQSRVDIRPLDQAGQVSPLTNGSHKVNAVLLLADKIATGWDDGTVLFSSKTGGDPVMTQNLGKTAINALAELNNGSSSVLAVALGNGTIRFLNDKGTLIGETLGRSGSTAVTRLDALPPAANWPRFLALRGNEVQVWEYIDSLQGTVQGRHEGPVYAVSWRLDKIDPPEFLSAGADGTIRDWTFDANQLKWKSVPTTPNQTTPSPVIYALAYNPKYEKDKNYLFASGGSDTQLWLWKPSENANASPYASKSFPGHKGPIYNIAWSGDGKRIATASADRTARVWSAADGSLLSPLSHKDSVAALAFRPPPDDKTDPDGNSLAALDFSRRITFWTLADLTSPTNDEAPLKLDSPAYSLTWDPYGKSVLFTAGKQVYYLNRDKKK